MRTLCSISACAHESVNNDSSLQVTAFVRRAVHPKQGLTKRTSFAHELEHSSLIGPPAASQHDLKATRSVQARSRWALLDASPQTRCDCAAQAF